jgi:hypothetical protein
MYMEHGKPHIQGNSHVWYTLYGFSVLKLAQPDFLADTAQPYIYGPTCNPCPDKLLHGYPIP